MNYFQVSQNLDLLLQCNGCIYLGQLKIINFPFGTNGKLFIFRCPKILGGIIFRWHNTVFLDVFFFTGCAGW